MDFFKDTHASAVPLLMFILVILVCGALYSLFFLEIGFPELLGYIPDSDASTLTMMFIYALPLIIAVTGVWCLIKEGQKRTYGGR